VADEAEREEMKERRSGRDEEGGAGDDEEAAGDEEKNGIGPVHLAVCSVLVSVSKA
jgi:hypothetical protein